MEGNSYFHKRFQFVKSENRILARPLLYLRDKRKQILGGGRKK
jgi:hypothetical protein